MLALKKLIGTLKKIIAVSTFLLQLLYRRSQTVFLQIKCTQLPTTVWNYFKELCKNQNNRKGMSNFFTYIIRIYRYPSLQYCTYIRYRTLPSSVVDPNPSLFVRTRILPTSSTKVRKTFISTLM